MSAVSFKGSKRIAAEAAEEVQLSANTIESLNKSAQTNQKIEKICRLTDEINQIAVTLARLSTSETFVVKSLHRYNAEGEYPQVSVQLLRSIVRARRLRDNYFPSDLFADPAWDMMIELLLAEIIQHRVPISSLCASAAVPATTALRWIKIMTDRGLVKRREDPTDRRRVFIELETATSSGLRRYFSEIGSLPMV